MPPHSLVHNRHSADSAGAGLRLLLQIGMKDVGTHWGLWGNNLCLRRSVRNIGDASSVVDTWVLYHIWSG